MNKENELMDLTRKFIRSGRSPRQALMLATDALKSSKPEKKSNKKKVSRNDG